MVHRWSKCLSTHRQIVRMVRFREEVLLDGFGQEDRDTFREPLNRFIQNLPKAVACTAKHFQKKEA